MARGLGDGRIIAYSAGLNPTGLVAQESIETVRELGYEPDRLFSKGLDEVPLDQIDVVVSLIGDAGLRYLPHGLPARCESWSIRDPYGDDEAVYRAVAKNLESRIRELVDDVLGSELVSF
jgi:arsenate reductase